MQEFENIQRSSKGQNTKYGDNLSCRIGQPIADTSWWGYDLFPSSETLDTRHLTNTFMKVSASSDEKQKTNTNACRQRDATLSQDFVAFCTEKVH